MNLTAQQAGQQHTPGPWTACRCNKCGMIYAAEHCVATVHLKTADGEDTDQELVYASITPEARRANMNLIAAAPDLLAVLQEIAALATETQDGVHSFWVGEAWTVKARAAIAKAQGIKPEQPNAF